MSIKRIDTYEVTTSNGTIRFTVPEDGSVATEFAKHIHVDPLPDDSKNDSRETAKTEARTLLATVQTEYTNALRDWNTLTILQKDALQKRLIEMQAKILELLF